MKKSRRFCIVFTLAILCFASFGGAAYADQEYRELHRVYLKMVPGDTKARLLKSEQQKIYQFFAEVKSRLKGNPLDPEITIIGQADNTGGKNFDNQGLADRRAKTVVDFIENLYPGDPARNIMGLKVAYSFGKVQGKKYDEKLNRYNSTDVVVILKQRLENYPIEISDVYGMQEQVFNHLDGKSTEMANQLNSLNSTTKEMRSILENDKKLATVMHKAGKITGNPLILTLIFVIVAALLALILLLLPKSEVSVGSGRIAEGVDDIRRRIHNTDIAISSNSDSVMAEVMEVAEGVREIKENISVSHKARRSTNQPTAEVTGMKFGGKSYTVHLENQDGLLMSPFRRPKKEGLGEFLSFYTMQTSDGGNKQIARIFMRAQNAKNGNNVQGGKRNDVNQHWKDQIEFLINNPEFSGPRLIQEP